MAKCQPGDRFRRGSESRSFVFPTSPWGARGDVPGSQRCGADRQPEDMGRAELQRTAWLGAVFPARYPEEEGTSAKTDGLERAQGTARVRTGN